eukprot:scaffold3835_cov295-Chaetoceros_neogracile.AAC.20
MSKIGKVLSRITSRHANLFNPYWVNKWILNVGKRSFKATFSYRRKALRKVLGCGTNTLPIKMYRSLCKSSGHLEKTKSWEKSKEDKGSAP